MARLRAVAAALVAKRGFLNWGQYEEAVAQVPRGRVPVASVLERAGSPSLPQQIKLYRQSVSTSHQSQQNGRLASGGLPRRDEFEAVLKNLAGQVSIRNLSAKTPELTIS